VQPADPPGDTQLAAAPRAPMQLVALEPQRPRLFPSELHALSLRQIHPLIRRQRAVTDLPPTRSEIVACFTTSLTSNDVGWLQKDRTR
jgi:hypothetical protein